MQSMFIHLKKLYDFELYENVISIAQILLTAHNHERANITAEVLTSEQYFLTTIYYANSFYEERLYRKAEAAYRIALQARKPLNTANKLKSTFTGGNNLDILVASEKFCETEIRFKIAKCLEVWKEYSEAVTVLQAIPNKQRSPKVNMLLSKLLQQNDFDKGAVLPLKAILKECPLNLEVIKNLLALRIKPTEVLSIIAECDLTPYCLDWLHNYINGFSHIYTCKYTAAIESFKAIELRSDIGNAEVFQIALGQAYHYLGNYDMAIHYLQRVYDKTTFMTDGLMNLATLYVIKNRIDDLQKLTQMTYQMSEYLSEHWFVIAQHLYCQTKYEKAAFFVQKSYYLTPKNIEVSLLRVKIFMALKKYKEAILTLRLIEQYAFYRFELYESFVDAYIVSHRIREAQEISRTVVRRHAPNISARCFVLLAKPYFHNGERLDKIKSKSLITQALQCDEYYLPAVYMLFEILQEEGDIAGAKKLIKKQLTVQPKSKLFSMLGDLQSHEKDLTKAVENYTIAINMDPTNRKAVAGLIAMGQSMVTKTDADGYSAPSSNEESKFYMENGIQVEEIPLVNESESDSMWSDIETDPNA